MTSTGIHPTAVVHPSAKIDPSVSIGPHCVVGPDVTMGPGNRLLSHVVIDNFVEIGRDNLFHPFSVIGGLPQDLKYKGERTKVEIGDRNVIRESVTINLGTEGGTKVTKIGSDNLLMSCVHVGHDTWIGNSTVVGGGSQIAGHVLVEDFAIIGGMTGISQFIRLGTMCYVGGCSGVDRDMPPFSLGRGPSPGFEVWGMNLVGLKRKGYDSASISALQEVSKLYFKDKSLEKEAALKRIEETLGQFEVVQRFVKFVRASEKGVYR